MSCVSHLAFIQLVRAKYYLALDMRRSPAPARAKIASPNNKSSSTPPQIQRTGSRMLCIFVHVSCCVRAHVRVESEPQSANFRSRGQFLFLDPSAQTQNIQPVSTQVDNTAAKMEWSLTYHEDDRGGASQQTLASTAMDPHQQREDCTCPSAPSSE